MCGKSGSQRYIIGKWRSILIAVLDSCGCFSLILYQHPRSGSFLRVSCNMESEILLISFFVCYQNPVGFLNEPFPRCDFLTSCIGHLQDYGFLSYADLPNVDISEVFKYRDDVSFTVADKSFPKFWFLLESLSFILGNKYSQLFSLKRQTHFIHFSGTVCQILKSE